MLQTVTIRESVLTGDQAMNDIVKTAIAYCFVIVSLNAAVTIAVLATMAQ